MPDITPPAGLYEAVLARVAGARRHAARVQFAVLSVLSCVFTVLSITALQYALAEASVSGFGSYLSLVFSDGSLVLTSREFALSLVESLPALAMLLLLCSAGALAWSLTRTWRSARSAFTYA